MRGDETPIALIGRGPPGRSVPIEEAVKLGVASERTGSLIGALPAEYPRRDLGIEARRVLLGSRLVALQGAVAVLPPLALVVNHDPPSAVELANLCTHQRRFLSCSRARSSRTRLTSSTGKRTTPPCR